MSELADVFENLLAPLRAASVALIGIWLAWQWSQGALAPPIIIITVIAIGYACDLIGNQLLPGRPVAAVYFLEFWILVPLMAAAAASALTVVLAIRLALPQDAPSATKEITYDAIINVP